MAAARQPRTTSSEADSEPRQLAARCLPVNFPGCPDNNRRFIIPSSRVPRMTGRAGLHRPRRTTRLSASSVARKDSTQRSQRDSVGSV